ncbi:MAG: hypothetical protein ACLRUM_07840 [Veillonella parvula]
MPRLRNILTLRNSSKNMYNLTQKRCAVGKNGTIARRVPGLLWSRKAGLIPRGVASQSVKVRMPNLTGKKTFAGEAINSSISGCKVVAIMPPYTAGTGDQLPNPF